MIETIARVNLMVNEVLKIKKNRLMPDVLTGKERRIALVSGIYGDELQGPFICYEVIKRIKKNFDCLKGIVDIYPYINPMAMEAKTREIPGSELDMNELFPGARSGATGEYVARCLMDDILKAEDGIPKTEFCLDVHGSNMYLKEIPQIRLNDDVVDQIMPYATYLNTDMIWVHPSNQVKDGSLVYELNARGVISCVTESTSAYKIDQKDGMQIVDGIFAMMQSMGMWDGEVEKVKKPTVAYDSQMTFINSESSGLFIPKVDIHDYVDAGMRIGSVVNVLTGSVEEKVIAPRSGVITAIRDYPAIEMGSLLARIVSSGD